MISRLEGKVLMRSDRFLIIDVNNIGYKIFVTPKELKNAKKDENFSLWTHLHVREDAMELYGFGQYAEMEFFEALIQISGIGPKSALGVLSVAPLDTIKKAISSGETSYLTKVSGIGRKTAEKIVLELRDKLGALESQDSGMFKQDQDVLSALESLGYSKQEAREAIKQVSETIEGAGQRVKEALKILGKQ
jgi:holliday junction DNA helicase RuvA